ncbi:MAG: glycogen synthase GlgA [Bacillota bacterium]|nr:glycogen synthase GlgA [Bacillota bacterium]
MKQRPKILFATFEAEPFAKTGGLGDVCGSLPGALNGAGCDVRVMLPKFKTMPEKFRKKLEHVTDFRVDLAWRNQYCGIETLTLDDVIYYFIDNEYYFNRDKLYGYGDDGERTAYFSKAVAECISFLPGFFPDIIHCHDWHAALAPVYLRENFNDDSKYGAVKTVFTIHNLKYQGVFPGFYLGDVLGLDNRPNAASQLKQFDAVNYMRGALNYSDRLTTVSPTYADEICTDFYGERAQDIFIRRRGILTGILNGIDNKKYDPGTDKDIYLNYLADSFDKKSENKKFLQVELGLEANPGIPLIVLISRLTEQKGLDLVVRVFGELMQENVQFAVLGVGDKKYEDAFRHFTGLYPGRVSARLAFDEGLSRKLYAGADLLLVPSLFEPCGLTQMIAMRYGTLPIVRETGGLNDSVRPYNKFTGEGNGFSFTNFNAHELLDTVRGAVRLYFESRDKFEALARNAMNEDYSWSASAKKYAALYKDMLK